MSWTEENYPDSMKNLEKSTRNKAIEIANSLLQDDFDEPRSIAIAITQAKEWAIRKKVENSNGEDQHIIPHKGKWEVLKEGSKKASYICDSKEASLKKAREISEEEESKIIVHDKPKKPRNGKKP